jgi:hypothetical protein
LIVTRLDFLIFDIVFLSLALGRRYSPQSALYLVEATQSLKANQHRKPSLSQRQSIGVKLLHPRPILLNRCLKLFDNLLIIEPEPMNLLWCQLSG